MRTFIPNLVTMCNLCAGSIAVLCLIYGHLQAAVWLVIGAAFADFMDGAIARALGVFSSLGKQLDSLADVISFGLVPGVMLYGLLGAALQGGVWPETMVLAALPAFLLTVFAAWRLGKFNIDHRQSEGFIGLPTPACTLFMVGLLVVYQTNRFGLGQVLGHPVVLYGILIAFSWLMVAEIPMFSLKFKGSRWAGNEIKYIFVAVSAVALIWMREAAFSAIILLYIAMSIGRHLLTRNSG